MAQQYSFGECEVSAFWWRTIAWYYEILRFKTPFDPSIIHYSAMLTVFLRIICVIDLGSWPSRKHYALTIGYCCTCPRGVTFLATTQPPLRFPLLQQHQPRTHLQNPQSLFYHYSITINRTNLSS